MELQSGVRGVISIVKIHSTNSFYCSFGTKRDLAWISIFHKNISIGKVTPCKDYIKVLDDKFCKEATI